MIISLVILFTVLGLTTQGMCAEKPQYGGKMLIIYDQGPSNIGHAPSMSFRDHIPDLLFAERLMDMDTKGNLVPCLAESWETSPDGLTITIHLRKGVKFHDGTTMTSKDVKWTMDECNKAGSMPGGKYIKSVDIVDDYTVQFKLSERNNQIIFNIWRPFIFSKTAFDKHGKDWAVTHCVSTAAFRVVDFKRDISVKLEKFDDYWRKDRPYLDKAELRMVKEQATCMALMQAKQADFWMGAAHREAADLRDAGFRYVTGPRTLYNIYPDTKNPGSIFADKRIREAIEYAMDRPAISKALGFGFTEPCNQLANPGSYGYNPNYKERAYNPEKAKQLLADAGYPNGFKTVMTLRQSELDTAVVVQNYLKAVGIEVKLDVSDIGRYWGKIFADGWEGLLLGVSAINPEYCVGWLDHFGPAPVVKFVSLAKSPEYLAICEKLVKAPDVKSMRALTMDMVTQAGEDAMFIPIYYDVGVGVMQDNTHTTYYTALDWTGWTFWNDWKGK